MAPEKLPEDRVVIFVSFCVNSIKGYARTVPVAAGPLPEKKEERRHWQHQKFDIKSFSFYLSFWKKWNKKGPVRVRRQCGSGTSWCLHIACVYLRKNNNMKWDWLQPTHNEWEKVHFKVSKLLDQDTKTPWHIMTSATWLKWNKQELKFLQEENHEQTPSELSEAQTSRGTGIIKMCQRARQ